MGDTDHRIIDLTTEIGKASDIHVPIILLRFKEYLEMAKSGSGESSNLISDFWKLDLVPIMVVVLKQDFSRIRQNWNTASQLARLVVDVLRSINSLPLDNKENFETKTVTEAGENLLILIRRIQDRYTSCLADESLATEMPAESLLDRYDEIIKTMIRLINCFPKSTAKFLKSPWFLQIFITDDEATGMGVLDLLNAALKISPNIFTEVPNRLLQSILDELIYHLSTSDNVNLAGVMLNLLLTICKVYPTCINILSTKYHGLRLLLSRWMGKHGTVSRDLSQLLQFLEGGTQQQVEMDRDFRSAVLIQSVWRSFLSRRRMSKANHGIARLQVTFRNRREIKDKLESENKEQKELKHQIVLARQRRVRHRHEEELELMDTLPAPIIARKVESEQREAALQIQSTWRGHRERLQLDTRREFAKESRAAITIQRQVRHWLARLEMQRIKSQLLGHGSGLTETRREELQRVHDEWCLGRPNKHLSREDQEQLYRSAQLHLHKNLYERRKGRRQDQERLSNLARLETDASILTTPPRLDEVSSKQAEQYSSRSLPIAQQASRLHAERLRRIEAPWWRQLIPPENSLQEFDDCGATEYGLAFQESRDLHPALTGLEDLKATCCQ